MGWTYNAAGLDLDFLEESEKLTLGYRITAEDENGESASQSIQVEIVGKNDGPRVTSQLIDTSTNEEGINQDRTQQPGINSSTTEGELWNTNVYDPEGDSMDLEVVNAGEIVGTYGTLTLNSNGSYSYKLDNSNSAVNSLAEDESLDDVFQATINDKLVNLSATRELI